MVVVVVGGGITSHWRNSTVAIILCVGEGDHIALEHTGCSFCSSWCMYFMQGVCSSVNSCKQFRVESDIMSTCTCC